MKPCPDFPHLLVLPHLKVQGANAIGSQLTHGFPSITAFLGLMWALERKLVAQGTAVYFTGIGVVAHSTCELSQPGRFVSGFHLTRNPPALRGHRKVIAPDGTTGTAAIVEEGRMHMEISLLLAARDSNVPAQSILGVLMGLRIAGGSVLPRSAREQFRHPPCWVNLTGTPEDQEGVFATFRHKLLPGFALIERRDLLEQRLKQLRQSTPDVTPLDAWLSRSRWNFRWQPDADNLQRGRWQNDHVQGGGWIVPIPIGYGALGPQHPAGAVENARDPTIPFCFVESLYSLGEWRSPHRISHPRELLWYADSNPEAGLYRARNVSSTPSPAETQDTYVPDYD